MVVRDGRFGPYVTDGTTNASLRRGDEVESITLERAAELLAERRAAGPSTRTQARPDQEGGGQEGRTQEVGGHQAAGEEGRGQEDDGQEDRGEEPHDHERGRHDVGIVAGGGVGRRLGAARSGLRAVARRRLPTP